MSAAADIPDAAGLTAALDVIDELHRRLGDDGLRTLGELHRRRRVGALLVAVRASAADHRARELPTPVATAEAIADMRAGAARSPMLHTLARALRHVRDDAGPSVATAVQRLAGDVRADMLHAIECAVAQASAPRRAEHPRPGDDGRTSPGAVPDG